MKKILVLIVSALLMASCLPQNIRVPQSPLLPLLERKLGLIGYVGIDGNIYVADQSGRNPTQLTKDARLPKSQGQPLLLYEYPTWSRDGSQMAFIGIGSDGAVIRSNVMIANVDDNSVREVYNSMDKRPVFLNWSPDNQNLSFISSDPYGQNIVLQSVPSQGGQPTVMDVGSPYYWSWAPDGQVMIVHAGGAADSSPERTAFLSLHSKQITEQVLETAPASAGSSGPQAFQAPAWSPDGRHIAFARTGTSSYELMITDSAGENPKKIGTFGIKTAFAWSSDGTRLAYIDATQPIDPGVVGTLHVYDLETSKEVTEEGNIVGFFWSPNGEMLAYFNLVPVQPNSSASGTSGDSSQTSTQLALQLNVLDVNSGQSHKVFTYVPTDLFMSILPFFDQYHQAVTIWSPDNNNLVLSLVDSNGTPSIAIIAASGKLEPRLLAEGHLAFWSWK